MEQLEVITLSEFAFVTFLLDLLDLHILGLTKVIQTVPCGLKMFTVHTIPLMKDTIVTIMALESLTALIAMTSLYPVLQVLQHYL